MKRGETVSDSSVKERFEEIYDKTYDSVYRYLITKVSPREAAEDIVQNCYLEFYKKMLDGEQILMPKHFLLTMAKRRAADYYRSFTPTEDIDDHIAICDEKALKELENDDSFEYEQIMKLIAESDDTAYRIFYLHFHCGHTLEKTARELSMSESTVKSKIYRMLKKLRKQLTEGEENAFFGRSNQIP